MNASAIMLPSRVRAGKGDAEHKPVHGCLDGRRRMKLRKPIAGWLFFAWVVGSVAVAQIGPATGRGLLITDVHLDPLADPAIVKQLIASPVAQWGAIFQSSQQKSLSSYGTDTNYRLFSSTLAEA